MSDNVVFTIKLDDAVEAGLALVDGERAAKQAEEQAKALQRKAAEGLRDSHNLQVQTASVTRLNELTVNLRAGLARLPEIFAQSKLKVTEKTIRHEKARDEAGFERLVAGTGERAHGLVAPDRHDTQALHLVVKENGEVGIFERYYDDGSHAKTKQPFEAPSLADPATREANSLRIITDSIANLARRGAIKRPLKSVEPAPGNASAA